MTLSSCGSGGRIPETIPCGWTVWRLSQAWFWLLSGRQSLHNADPIRLVRCIPAQGRGELAALVGVEDFRVAEPSQAVVRGHWQIGARPILPSAVRLVCGNQAAWAWSGYQRNLDDMPPPNGPAYVGVDGGFVRDRAGSWFGVVIGKSVPGFGRDAPEDDPPRPAKCLAFVQVHDDRPRRRLLDWFHIMRLTVLRQTTKGACPADSGGTERRLRDLGRLKWLL